jgi:hypothetical protein
MLSDLYSETLSKVLLNFNNIKPTYCIIVPPLRSGVRDRVCHVRFCGGQSGAGVGFLRVLRFPLPNFIPPIAKKIILIYHRGLYNRPKWPQYQGLRYIPRDLNRYLGT